MSRLRAASQLDTDGPNGPQCVRHQERLRDGPVDVATTSVIQGKFPSHQVPKADR